MILSIIIRIVAYWNNTKFFKFIFHIIFTYPQLIAGRYQRKWPLTLNPSDILKVSGLLSRKLNVWKYNIFSIMFTRNVWYHYKYNKQFIHDPTGSTGNWWIGNHSCEWDLWLSSYEFIRTKSDPLLLYQLWLLVRAIISFKIAWNIETIVKSEVPTIKGELSC